MPDPWQICGEVQPIETFLQVRVHMAAVCKTAPFALLPPGPSASEPAPFPSWPRAAHWNGRYARRAYRLHLTVHERRFGDLISYQNGGKGWLVIPNEIEQTVSEHASSHHCYRQARWSGRAAYTSGCQKSGT